MRWPALLLLIIAATGCASGGADSDPAEALRVSTYNIRFGTANDGPNHWDLRQDALIDSIKAFDPDVLGTQETLASQRDLLVAQMPDYVALAAGRDDGREAGEMTAVLYKADRFDLLASGHFWLSESPETVASIGWDASMTRMATWLKLRDRRSPAGRPILVINTHFDHVGKQARLESARLIRRRAAELGDGCSIVILGDFNCGEDEPPYRALVVGDESDDLKLIDAYRVAHPERGPNEGTFHGFKPETAGNRRIDWVVVSDDFQVVSAEIDRRLYRGRIPSDHFAVNAVLKRHIKGRAR
jgi:endonuclease/exonuclease/phosphatase family metal-dependent hydrolase